MAVEDKFARAVLQIAGAQPSGTATFYRCRSEVPKLVALTAAELAPSKTRRGEPMWHQFVRNIKSHSTDEGNYIYEGLLEHVPRVGYRITGAGRARLKANGN